LWKKAVTHLCCSAKDESHHIEEVVEPKTGEQFAHVDESIARKVAANVDDFMVRYLKYHNLLTVAS